MIVRSGLALAASIALLLAPGASAQDYGVFDMGVLGMNGAIDHVTRAERARGATPGGSAPALGFSGLSDSLSAQIGGGAGQADMATADGSYRPDPAVRRKLAEILARAAAKNGAQQEADMRKLVLSGQAVREYEKIAPAFGFRANDAIDGLAFYMLAQWGVANDYRPMFTRAQAAGVRRQAANAFASVAAQVGTDALRQEFGEMLMIQGAIMAGVHETAVRNGDEAAVARYASMAREGGTQLFTMDPTAVELTDEGFRRR